MLPDLATMFVLGLVSSLHCVQMCGPIVLSISLGFNRPAPLAHLAYNAGRILIYMVLGAIAGSAGDVVGLLGRLAGWERALAIGAGALMILAGCLLAGFSPGGGRLIQIGQQGSATVFSKLFSATIGRWLVSQRVGSKFVVGLGLGFLPCGLIYAALLKSLASGSPLAGALDMGAFGFGTAIALLTLGMFSTAIGFKVGRWSNSLAAVSVVLMGAALVWRGAMMAPSTTGGVAACHEH